MGAEPEPTISEQIRDIINEMPEDSRTVENTRQLVECHSEMRELAKRVMTPEERKLLNQAARKAIRAFGITEEKEDHDVTT